MSWHFFLKFYEKMQGQKWKCRNKNENARTKMKMQGQKGKCKDDTKSYSLDRFEQVERSKIVLVVEKNFWNSRLKAENFCKFFTVKDQNRNGILLPKLYRPTVRKNCSTDGEKLLKFETEGQEFAKKNHEITRIICSNSILKQHTFLTCFWNFFRPNKLEQSELEG